MPDTYHERRRFDRIATDKTVRLRHGDAQFDGLVLDISLRGVLLEIQGDWRPRIDSRLHAEIQLEGEEPGIAMDGEVAHVDGRRIGLHCTGIDLESASRLRRLVELNLQDDQLLERNLAQLLLA